MSAVLLSGAAGSTIQPSSLQAALYCVMPRTKQKYLAVVSTKARNSASWTSTKLGHTQGADGAALQPAHGDDQVTVRDCETPPVDPGQLLIQPGRR